MVQVLGLGQELRPVCRPVEEMAGAGSHGVCLLGPAEVRPA